MRSAGWTATGFGLQYALRLVSTLFLTRLLTPEAFGLMSIATVIMIGLALISDVGTTQSVIKSKHGEDTAFLQTAWSLQVVRGGIITMAACLLAWPLARLYEEPLLFPVTAALSITALLQGFLSISIPLAKRRMELRKLTLLEVSVHAFTIIVTILTAWLFRSVWALVIGAIFGELLKLTLSHLVFSRFAHTFRWDRNTLSEILVYGRWILLGTLLTFLGGKGITAIQGTLVPLDILGMIGLAGTISWALRDLIDRVLGTVAFPALSEIIRDRPHDTIRALRRIQLVLIGSGIPCFLLLSFIAQDLIGIMYDDRYMMAGVFLMVMAIGSAAGTLSMPYQDAMLAMGDSKTHAFIMGLAATFKITAVVVGFHVGGIIWMIAATGFAELAVLLVSASFARRHGIANLPLDFLAITTLISAYALVIPLSLSLV
jgi:O-antigen/teichoic acid export membrane protein